MSDKKTTLVVLAAGMGSRFGGLKQMEPFGPHGETIVDYSVFDAVRAGFDRAVIIIKKSIEKDFRELVGRRLEKMTDVAYAFQEADKLPAGYTAPEGRTKPYGTAHAILCARDLVKTPFCVVNSDDFYGAESYKLVHDFLEKEDKDYCIAGYRLGNTLTENGTVNRGVCTVENGYLTHIVETLSIDRNSGIPLDTLGIRIQPFGVKLSDFIEGDPVIRTLHLDIDGLAQRFKFLCLWHPLVLQKEAQGFPVHPIRNVGFLLLLQCLIGHKWFFRHSTSSLCYPGQYSREPSQILSPFMRNLNEIFIDSFRLCGYTNSRISFGGAL